jgi:hypothetical protein
MAKEETISIEDLANNNFEYKNLLEILEETDKIIYTKAINNALLSLIYKKLKIMEDDKIFRNDGKLLVIYLY